MRKNLTLAFFALFCALTAAAQLHNDDVHVHQAVSRQNYRQYLRIPDIGGYITLKCDFHVHSDISDGQVWPVGRVNEAWNDGLDAIAMTDHIEVHKNADIIRCGLNKPYELAKARGDMIGMIVIPGAGERESVGVSAYPMSGGSLPSGLPQPRMCSSSICCIVGDELT